MSDYSQASVSPCTLGGDAAEQLSDRFGRIIDYLRVSLTTACNLRCLYCRPCGVSPNSAGADCLTDDDIVQVAEAAASLGVTAIRFTGGEPLMRPNLSALIRRVAGIGGIRDISMTTNGVLFAERALDLANAGLTRVNISLDSANAWEYKRIAGRDALHSVLRAIDSALAVGLHPVKINAVLGLSADWKREALDVARLALELPVCVRYIERMPTTGGRQPDSMSARDLVDVLAGEWDLTPAAAPHGRGPARYFHANGAPGLIGVISPLSAPFCSTCNRMRVSARCCLHPCLFSGVAVGLRPALSAPIAQRQGLLRRAFRASARAKPGSHGLPDASITREMADIGG